MLANLRAQNINNNIKDIIRIKNIINIVFNILSPFSGKDNNIIIILCKTANFNN